MVDELRGCRSLRHMRVFKLVHPVPAAPPGRLGPVPLVRGEEPVLLGDGLHVPILGQSRHRTGGVAEGLLRTEDQDVHGTDQQTEDSAVHTQQPDSGRCAYRDSGHRRGGRRLQPTRARQARAVTRGALSTAVSAGGYTVAPAVVDGGPARSGRVGGRGGHSDDVAHSGRTAAASTCLVPSMLVRSIEGSPGAGLIAQARCTTAFAPAHTSGRQILAAPGHRHGAPGVSRRSGARSPARQRVARGRAH